jgi:hypothetical protein
LAKPRTTTGSKGFRLYRSAACALLRYRQALQDAAVAMYLETSLGRGLETGAGELAGDTAEAGECWWRREATGDMIIVRYADDFIVGFQHEADARRFLAMRERLQEFALSLHQEKTRLIEFGCLAVENRKRRGLGKPETFPFLGFIFICSKTRRGKSRSNGNPDGIACG